MLQILRGWLRGASRRPLTGKTGPRQYYKGKGAPSIGRLTSKGNPIALGEICLGNLYR